MTVVAPARTEHERRTRIDLPRRWALAAGWTLLCLPFALELLVILRSSHGALVRRLPDDALYYLEIATRFMRGEGFTFDGINSTNGFHPLWQALLVPVVGLTGAGTDESMRAALVLALLCSFAAVLLVLRLVWRVSGPAPALLGGIFAAQYGLDRWVNGMEGPVVLLSLALLATALASADRDRRLGGAVLAGIASAFLVLARLDFAPVLPVVGIALALRSRSFRRVGAWLCGVCLIGVPAATWWLMSWGHILSTSATVKEHWLSRGFGKEYGGRATAGYVRYLIGEAVLYVKALFVEPRLAERAFASRGLGAATQVAEATVLATVVLAVFGWLRVGLAAIRRRRAGLRRSWGPEAWGLGVVVVVVATKTALDVVSTPLWATGWYAAPQQFACGFLLGAGVALGVRAVLDRSRPLGIVAVVIVGVLALPPNGLAWLDEVRPRRDASWQGQIDLAADWIIAKGPTGRYGAFDAGLLGYRLDGFRTVVNLDGLVNDYDYVDFLVTDPPIRRVFRAAGTEIIVGRLSPADFRSVAACGEVLWRSPRRIVFRPDFGEYSSAPVRVVDVRGC